MIIISDLVLFSCQLLATYFDSKTLTYSIHLEANRKTNNFTKRLHYR